MVGAYDEQMIRPRPRSWIELSTSGGVLLLCVSSLACDDRAAKQPATPPVTIEPGKVATAGPPPKLDPQLLEAFRLIKSGRHADARLRVEAYLQAPGAAHPGQAEFLVALSYHEDKLYQSADPHFARAIELEPDYFTACFFHGFTLFNLGRLDEAKRLLETFLARSPEEAEAIFGLGLVALEQDRVDDAKDRIERAIAVAERKAASTERSADAREDLARYQARLGDVHLRRDDLDQARAAFERSVELWPEHGEPWHKLARVLQRLGDTAGAERAQARSNEALARRAARGDQPR